ncbi:hypothetical protein SFC65_19930 [Priestia filamentosa]|uniref:hypothetical protein n=1 Tax=Priestia filamentosa TaxID=1402861 RepID=UPI003981B2A6
MDELARIDEIKNGLEQLQMEYDELGYKAELDFVFEKEQAIVLNIIDGDTDYFVKVHFKEIDVSETIYAEDTQKFMNEISINIKVTFKINDEEEAHPLGRTFMHNFMKKTGLHISEKNLMSSKQNPSSNVVH